MNREAILKTAQDLIRTPSQAGIDAPDSIIDCAKDHADRLGLDTDYICDGDKTLAMTAHIAGYGDGPVWALNACIDTAPVGDRSQWDRDPFSGDIDNRGLHGRGSGDSKIAAAMFIHLMAEMQDHAPQMQGDLMLILDADEHSGAFGGIRTTLRRKAKPEGVMIGYPGNDELIIGARGFARYEITVRGVGAHSGARAMPEDNALVRMSDLVQRLTAQQPPQEQVDWFRLSPKITVTGVEGGDGFSVVPSKTVIKVDVRLTPTFLEKAADAHIERIVRGHDAVYDVPRNRQTVVKRIASEPPFALPDYARLRLAMRDAIAAEAHPVPEKIANPSNIGCFLRSQGIDATAGYGLVAHNIHAANEYVELDKLEQVYAVYRGACNRLLGLNP